MEWVKTTAKTLPEAIDLALDNLGVDESEAEIVVLEEPRPGLFGRMRGTARVEARVKPKAIRPKTERNRNRKGRGEGGRGKGGDRNKNRNRNRSDGGNNRRSGNRDKSDSNQDSNRGRDNQSAKADGRSDGGGNRKNAGGGNRGGGDRAKGGGGRAAGGDQNDRPRRSKARNTNNQNEAKPKEETPVEEVADHLQNFLSGLTEAFGFDSAVSVDSSEQDVLVGRIEGQHGLLVGPKGRTLDAVQELARISCQRTVPSSIRIKVDVGGYRQQRVEALTAFAQKAADSAVEGGQEVALEPMSPADRKAIHDALSEDGRVETRSVGNEPRRKVLVVPLETSADEDDGDTDDAIDMDADSDVDTGSDVDADGHDAEGGDGGDGEELNGQASEEMASATSAEPEE